MGGDIPGQAVLDGIREQAKQAVRDTSVSSVSPWLLLEFLPCPPSVMDRDLEVSADTTPWVAMVFITDKQGVCAHCGVCAPSALT